MCSSTPTIGALLVCDLNGTIRRVVHDQLGITERCSAGTRFLEIFDHASVDKAAEFIKAVCAGGSAFDWQLCVVIDGRISLLHCMGFIDSDELWIILAHNQVDIARILDEMSHLQNDQTNMLRAVLKNAIQGSPTAKSESQFDDLTGLYNDLGRMQRELAQRNAELEAIRGTLESKQAELMAANAKLDELAMTDGLTGIANRRTFQSRLETECARAGRYQPPLALLMLDIDHFKSLNDTYGHMAGDDILILLGRLLTACSRKTDFAARYGGEEFAVILSDTDKDAANEVAERLRARIESHQWPHRAITASIGLASWEAGMESAADLIRQADKALYYSKEHGRNRVTHIQDIHLEAAPSAG